MITELFYWFLNMSILGSLTGFIIIALRRIKGIPRFAIYLLWAVPLVSFWLPLGITNRYSLMSLLSKAATKTVIVYEGSGLLPYLSFSNTLRAAESYFPIVYKTNTLENVFGVASVAWIIIALGAFLSAVLLYAFTKSELKDATKIKDNIYQSSQISSPTVYGILRPKIFLPVWADENSAYILDHEKVHLKRRDNLFRFIAITTACFHWFNPSVWYFLKYFFEDMELACDEMVLRDYSAEQKKAYAAALLCCAENQKHLFASAFGSSKVKVRIEKVLSYKRLTTVSFVCFAGLVAAIAIVLLTNSPG